MYYRNPLVVEETRILGPSPRVLVFNQVLLAQMSFRSLRTARATLSTSPTVAWTECDELPTTYSTGEGLPVIYSAL